MLFGVSEIAEKNMGIMDDVVSKKCYQKGYPNWKGIHELNLPKEPGAQEGVTWCNEAANEIAVRCGYDTKPLLHSKGIGWTGANDMYKNAWRAILEGKIKRIFDPGIAYYNANRGDIILVLAHTLCGRSGHIAVIRPFPKSFLHKKGLRITQAGEKNGSFWLKDIFNIPDITPVLMIALNKEV